MQCFYDSCNKRAISDLMLLNKAENSQQYRQIYKNRTKMQRITQKKVAKKPVKIKKRRPI